MAALLQQGGEIDFQTHLKPDGQTPVLNQPLPMGVAGPIRRAVRRQCYEQLAAGRQEKREQQGFADIFTSDGPDREKDEIVAIRHRRQRHRGGTALGK